MDWGNIGRTAWTATQSSVSVLLIILYGYISHARAILSAEGLKNLSRVTTVLFLPALYFAEIGPQADLPTLLQYWPIILVSLLSISVSYIYAVIGYKYFKDEHAFPKWIIPSCMFNVSITLPLLLLDSLKWSGAFKDLFENEKEVDEAIRRARAYYLINALVQSLIKFSVAPSLMGDSTSQVTAVDYQQTRSQLYEETDFEGEETSLLTESTKSYGNLTISTWKRKLLDKLNPPLLGSSAAFVLGIIPFFHSLFFGKGQVFTNTITQSLSKVGDLYAPVQVFILGAQLSRAHQKPPTNGVSKAALVYLLLFRLMIIPIIFICTITALRRWNPDLFRKDPMLDYVLMMAAVGPPTTNVAAFAELAGVSEDTANSVAYMLFVSYFASPLMSIPITGAIALISAQKDLYITM